MNNAVSPSMRKHVVGEEIVHHYLTHNGFTRLPPPHDDFYMSGERMYYVAVFAQARRDDWPDTGMNWPECFRLFGYELEYPNRVLVFFIDHRTKSIYGSEFMALLKPREVFANGKLRKYPLVGGPQPILYFAVDAMETEVGALPDWIVEKLVALSRSKHGDDKQQDLPI